MPEDVMISPFSLGIIVHSVKYIMFSDVALGGKIAEMKNVSIAKNKHKIGITMLPIRLTLRSIKKREKAKTNMRHEIKTKNMKLPPLFKDLGMKKVLLMRIYHRLYTIAMR